MGFWHVSNGQRELGWVSGLNMCQIRFDSTSPCFCQKTCKIRSELLIFTHPVLGHGSSRQELQRLSSKVQEALEEALGSELGLMGNISRIELQYQLT